jgi:hypothetical protein
VVPAHHVGTRTLREVLIVADQKRWFKVWTSILLDPAMNSLELADVGRWVRLGALAAAVGDRGQLTFPAGGAGLLTTLSVPDLEAAKCALQRLPHVVFEEGNRVNGTFTVTFKNWRKYQEDSTVAKRVADLRSKRRGEERRGEEKREPPTVPPLEAPPANILKALDQARLLGAVPRLRTMIFWRATIRATNNGQVDYAKEILKAEAWLTANPTRAPRKDLARFLSNWLERAGERA